MKRIVMVALSALMILTATYALAGMGFKMGMGLDTGKSAGSSSAAALLESGDGILLESGDKILIE